MSEVVSVTARNRRLLWITFGLTSTYLLVEIIGGLITNSLALLADAAHMLTDVAGLGLALFAAWMSAKPATPQKTYGFYRVEILAALVNAVLLFVMSFYIIFEAYRRFRDPPEVQSLPMLAVALVGLIVNLIGIRLLQSASKDSLNIQGAFLEVVGDLLGSLGVIVAGVIMWTTGWWYADPIFSVIIGLFILPRTWNLMAKAVDVLLEATPSHLNITEVKQAILDLEGVVSVHDLHVWTITSGIYALSAHTVVADDALSPIASTVVERVAAVLKEKFGIDHVTIQVEHVNRQEQEVNF